MLSNTPALRLGLALAAVYVIWGSTYYGIRVAIETLPPLCMSGARFIVAGVLLFLWAWVGRGKPPPTRRQWSNAAFVGVTLLVGGNGAVTYVEQWVDSGLVAVMVASMPLCMALFEGLYGRWPVGREWTGLIMGFAGVAALFMGPDLEAPFWAVVILALAPVTWAFGSVRARRLDLAPGMMGSAAQMLCGGGVMFLLGLARGERWTGPPSTASLVAWVYLLTFGSMVAYSAYQYLLANARASLASSYAYVNPVIALALGHVLAGERLSAESFVYAGVALAGVALLVTAKTRQT